LVALRVDRDAGRLGGDRVETKPALHFALDSSVLDLEAAGLSRKLDRAVFALVGASVSCRLTPRGETVSLATLLLSDEIVRMTIDEYRPHLVSRAPLDVAAVRVLPRTRWVDELVHRYVFERVQCERHDSAASRFLEIEITKEVFFLAMERDRAQTRASAVHDETDVARRAREWIEGRVFEPLRIADLARHAGASESTVLRAFRREHGVTPRAFHQGRRLDEARLLLSTGRYQVAEVALRVGYASVPSFTTAFKRRYGELPSTVLSPSDEIILPPAGGAPKR
jgi:AraC-like DNA-binding protein